MTETTPCAIRTFDGSYLTFDEMAEFGMRIEHRPEPLPTKKKVVIVKTKDPQCTNVSR